ncbi:hypothetical protein AAMO2058_001695600 [Amorphochlora amoebiformis]|eukprot:1352429-Amorphochlora_amoeboformis.AAC.2
MQHTAPSLRVRSLATAAAIAMLLFTLYSTTQVYTTLRQPTQPTQAHSSGVQARLRPRQVVKARLTRRHRQSRQFKEDVLKGILDREQERLMCQTTHSNHHAHQTQVHAVVEHKQPEIELKKRFSKIDEEDKDWQELLEHLSVPPHLEEAARV